MTDPRRYRGSLAVCFVALGVSSPALAQELVVAPYLQHGTASSMTVQWETRGPSDPTVLHQAPGATRGSTTGTSTPGSDDLWLHTVVLADLPSDQTITYQLAAFDAHPAASFRTPPAPGATAPLRFVVLSDMQNDTQNPGMFGQVVDGLVDWTADQYGVELHEAYTAALLPGDLVTNGSVVSQWHQDFFSRGASLFRALPSYPVLGNHEENAGLYFRYFVLPDNGEAEALQEHWWAKDIGQARLIGLDSNELYAIQPRQLAFLDEQLASACSNTEISTVLLQLHHPNTSELWPRGELGFAQVVADRLADFGTRCGKPALQLFGHTHGYASGVHPDGPVRLLNVGGAGGNLDTWGESMHVDYPHVLRSRSEYGFLVIEVETTPTPSYSTTWVSLGSPEAPTAPTVVESHRWVHDRPAPQQPQALSPAGSGAAAECITLVASSFAGASDAEHLASQWEVVPDCDADAERIGHAWQYAHNEFDEADSQAGADLRRVVVRDLPADAQVCWRVRYRDDQLTFSPWSDWVPLRTNPAALSPNLLQNPSADDGLSNWEVTGTVETPRNRSCGAAITQDGTRMFALGGVCTPADGAVMSQVVDLTPYAAQIDGPGLYADAGVTVQTGQLRGTATVRFDLLNAGGDVLESSSQTVDRALTFVPVTLQQTLPATTRQVRLTIEGAGAAAPIHVYADAAWVRVGTAPDCAAAGNETPAPNVVPTPLPPDEDAGLPDAGLPDAEPADATTATDVTVDTRPTPDVDLFVPDVPSPGPSTSVAGGGGCAAAPPALPVAWLLLGLGVVVRGRRYRGASRSTNA